VEQGGEGETKLEVSHQNQRKRGEWALFWEKDIKSRKPLNGSIAPAPNRKKRKKRRGALKGREQHAYKKCLRNKGLDQCPPDRLERGCGEKEETLDKVSERKERQK